MATKISPEVKEFLKRVRRKFKPEKIILFGSRAREDFLKGSDYDFIIISSHFTNMDFHDRVVAVLKLQRQVFPADFICLTPREFDERTGQLSIVQQAVREGVEVTAIA